MSKKELSNPKFKLPLGQADKLRLPEGEEGGIILKSEKQKNGNIKFWYQPGQYHHLVIGATGSGKTQTFIMPSILSIANAGGSMIINDPKGELAMLTTPYLKKKGYKTIIMDYLDPGALSCFNQLLLVQTAYDDGLPHYYAIKAIDAILKILDIISSNGEINNLEVFDIYTFNGSPASKPRSEQKDMPSFRTVTDGIGNSKTSKVLYIQKPSIPENFSSELLDKLCQADHKTILQFLNSALSSIYEQIEINAKKEKPEGLTAPLYSNEYLRIREEKTCQAAKDVIKSISTKNLISYYKAKKTQNEYNLQSAIPDSEPYFQAQQNIKDYEDKIKFLENNPLDFETIKDFLINLKADHEIVWKDYETTASIHAGSIAKMIIGSKASGDGKFWEQTATSLAKGLILLVCRESHLPYSKHLGSVARVMSMLTVPKLNGQKEETDLGLIISRYQDDDPIRNAFADSLMSAEKTRASIYVSANAPISIWGNYNVCDQSARCDFDPYKIAEEKTAIFMVSPGDDDGGSNQFTILSTLFIEETYSILNQCLAQSKDLTLPRPVYYLLDEVANIPAIPNLGSKVSLARSKNIRMNLVIQDFQQLKQKYKDDYDTVKANSDIIYLSTNDINTAKEISEQLGKETIETYSSSARASSNGSDDMSISTSSTGRELYTPQEVKQLPFGKSIYLMNRGISYESSYCPAYEMPIYSWLKQHQLTNLHIRRQPREINYFLPDNIEDYTVAYESLYKSIILDRYINNLFYGMGEVLDETTNSEEDYEEEDNNREQSAEDRIKNNDYRNLND